MNNEWLKNKNSKELFQALSSIDNEEDMSEQVITKNLQEIFIADVSSGSLLMETFLGYTSDGKIGEDRDRTLNLLWNAIQSANYSSLDDLFEQAYSYAEEFGRMSIAEELRTKMLNEALSIFPNDLIQETDEGVSYLPQKPITFLSESIDLEADNLPRLATYACKLGFSASILNIERNLAEVSKLQKKGEFTSAISELPELRSNLIAEILTTPDTLINQLLPDVLSPDNYESSRRTLELVIPEYFKTRVQPMIDNKRANKVSIAQDDGNQIYSRWAYIWEDSQEEKVREIFPEVDPNDKKEFYGKARELAEIQLTKDVIPRDIEKGSLPSELLTLIDNYLVEVKEGRLLGNSLAGFVEFINSQKDITEKLSDSIPGFDIQLGTIADFSRIGLRTEYSPPPSNELSEPKTDQVDIGEQETIELGARIIEFLPNYEVKYPPSVIEAFKVLVQEWNSAFGPLVDANREWDTDYQYCSPNQDAIPTNFMVQIDMQGLDQQYLEWANNKNSQVIADYLRNRVFEFENSIADYAYLDAVGVDIRPAIKALREKYSRPVMLLATTEQKYREMRVAEFGELPEGQFIVPEKVRNFSGFDGFMGPDEFRKYLKENNGECPALLYVRSSSPKSQLRDPRQRANQPFLSDPDMRRVVKANAVTFNIDNPSDPIGRFSRINDTKIYMLQLGMAYPIMSLKDITDVKFTQFLLQNNIIQSGILRAKPALESYGGYGQFRGQISDPKFIRQLNEEMRVRGPYIIQPELPNAQLIDQNGNTYAYIDRNYLGWDGSSYTFLGGERTLMPIDSTEVENGRIHANTDATLANISIMES